MVPSTDWCCSLDGDVHKLLSAEVLHPNSHSACISVTDHINCPHKKNGLLWPWRVLGS